VTIAATTMGETMATISRGADGPGDAVGGVRTRRELLHKAMEDLEAVIAAPLPGREQAWTRAVADSLDDLAAVFDRHVVAAEAPGAFLDQVVDDAPRLHHGAQQIRDDHGRLEAEIRELREHAGTVLADDGADAAEIRTAALRLLGGLAEHRQRGADLLYEAYQVDIGPGD
jgi:hypothetical protein